MTSKSDARSILRRNQHPDGRPLSARERERLVLPFLPPPPEFQGPKGRKEELKKLDRHDATRDSVRKPTSKWHRPRIRQLFGLLLQKALFFLIQLAFSIYINGRQIYHAILSQIFSILYYHHRSPELIQRDIRGLSRLPKHLSIILNLDNEDGSQRRSEALSKLIDDVAEVVAWCTCASIPVLSVYERTGRTLLGRLEEDEHQRSDDGMTGALKPHIPSLYRGLTRTLHSYFPPGALPSLRIRAPHLPAYSPPEGPENPSGLAASSLNVLLLSAADGRETLVDLTRTLTEMSQQGKLRSADITSDLIDAQVTESSCGEPDLLLLLAPSTYNGGPVRHRQMGGEKSLPRLDDAAIPAREDGLVNRRAGGADGGVCLRGYPPWQVRLTEIFHTQDSSGVEYQAFLRALHRYADAEMRFGR